MIYNNTDTSIIKSLLELSKNSNVGIGNKTVLDKKIRSSSEIIASSITLNKNFENMINEKVQKMSEVLEHPYEVKTELYKLITYKKGDKFSSHIDSPHSPEMIMTLSINIALQNEREGGDLCFGDYEIQNNNELSCVLFYNDIMHSITKVKKGYKLSLLFNVIQTTKIRDNILTKYKEQFYNGLDILKKNNIKKVGWLANHIYMDSQKKYNEDENEDQDDDEDMENNDENDIKEKNEEEEYTELITVNKLKGLDRITCLLFQEIGSLIKFKEVCDEDYIYDKKLLNIMQLSDAHNTLYRERDEDENEDKNSNDGWKSRKTEIKLNYDISNKFNCIKDEYLMGDILFLISNSKSKMVYCGSDDMHLGNEGFFGKIYTNLAIIAILP
jgi:hypothetical protein